MTSTSAAPAASSIVGGLPPPPGVIPNFIDPYSIIKAVHPAVVLTVVFTTLTTFLRLYTRFFIIKAHGWEDYSMFLAWAGFMMETAFAYKAGEFGAGVHQWDVPVSNLPTGAFYSYLSEISYTVVIALIKLSICLQFLRIFVVHRDWKFWFLQGFIVVNSMYYISALAATIFQCTPVQSLWSPDTSGSCITYDHVILTTACFVWLSDALMLAFPLYCIWNLQLRGSRKWGMIGIFFVGVLALVSSTLRLTYSIIIEGSQDQTYALGEIGACVFGELTAGMIVGNLVVAPAFFQRHPIPLPGFLSRHRASTSVALHSREVSDFSTPEVSPTLGNQTHIEATPQGQDKERIHEVFVELEDTDTGTDLAYLGRDPRLARRDIYERSERPSRQFPGSRTREKGLGY